MEKTVLQISTIICSLITQLCFTQYDSMIIENKLWTVVDYHYNWFGEIESRHTTFYKFEGDTLFNDKSYKILYYCWRDSALQNWYMESFYREDSLKVYEYRWEEEILRYDYSFIKGDSICSEFYASEYCWDWQYVDSVDTILIYGMLRKRLIFNYGEEDIWIEGVGSIYNPFYPVFPQLDWGWDLSCCYDGDQLIYKNEEFSECYVEYVNDINTNQNTTNKLQIFPNPFSDFTRIQLNEINPSEIRAIYLVNAYGQKIKEINITKDYIQLERGNLPSGLYFIQMIDKNYHICSERLIAL